MEHILTVDEVAKLLRMCKGTIYKYAERGIIPSFKIGTSLRFRDDQINQYLASCPTPTVQELVWDI